MKNMIKKIKKMLIPYVKQMRNFYILALEYGQFKTIKFWKSIDKYEIQFHGSHIQLLNI